MSLQPTIQSDDKPPVDPVQLELPMTFSQPDEWEDAQWVTLMPGSKRPDGPWKAKRPTYRVILDHAAEGGGIGLVPSTVGRVVRLAVLDVDGGDIWDLARAYDAVTVCKTPRGYHLWYHAPGGAGLANGKWEGPGGTHGDVRGVNGYVKLHGDEAVRVDGGLLTVEPGSCPVPLHLITSGGRRVGPGAKAANAADAANHQRAVSLFTSALREATPVLSKGVHVGNRHVSMVRRLARWSATGRWNKAIVDEWFISMRAAAYFMALPQRKTFPESEMVGILAWVLKMRPEWPGQGHTPEWLAKQAKRARGLVGRTKDGEQRQSMLPGVSTNEVLKPWEKEGIHRSTWYRRRARDRK